MDPFKELVKGSPKKQTQIQKRFKSVMSEKIEKELEKPPDMRVIKNVDVIADFTKSHQKERYLTVVLNGSLGLSYGYMSAKVPVKFKKYCKNKDLFGMKQEFQDLLMQATIALKQNKRLNYCFLIDGTPIYKIEDIPDYAESLIVSHSPLFIGIRTMDKQQKEGNPFLRANNYGPSRFMSSYAVTRELKERDQLRATSFDNSIESYNPRVQGHLQTGSLADKNRTVEFSEYESEFVDFNDNLTCNSKQYMKDFYQRKNSKVKQKIDQQIENYGTDIFNDKKMLQELAEVR
jgi:hypothetical protein